MIAYDNRNRRREWGGGWRSLYVENRGTEPKKKPQEWFRICFRAPLRMNLRDCPPHWRVYAWEFEKKGLRVILQGAGSKGQTVLNTRPRGCARCGTLAATLGA